MESKIWHVIGLMSGTSLDGLDLAYVKFEFNNGYNFDILASDTVKYSGKWKFLLSHLFSEKGEELARANVSFARLMAGMVRDFKHAHNIDKVDFLASHGHTVFHRPEEGYTLQVGDGATLSAETGHKVICDFRTQDVALGGQGAPLVPIGDALLFAQYDMCLNLGGFANISFEDGGQRKAFDICPVNIVMNHYCRNNGLEYDDKGSRARAGKLSEKLLSELDELDFYQLDEPKSLGYEFVVDKFFPVIDSFMLPLEDVLGTVAEHSARQIARQINSFVSSKAHRSRVLVTGGGAYNDFLIERIRDLSEAEVVIPKGEVIDFKEALIFAFLGLLRDQGKVNCLKSVTGARRDHSSGVIYDL